MVWLPLLVLVFQWEGPPKSANDYPKYQQGQDDQIDVNSISEGTMHLAKCR